MIAKTTWCAISSRFRCALALSSPLSRRYCDTGSCGATRPLHKLGHVPDRRIRREIVLVHVRPNNSEIALSSA
jgi:hypothetical protein